MFIRCSALLALVVGFSIYTARAQDLTVDMSWGNDGSSTYYMLGATDSEGSIVPFSNSDNGYIYVGYFDVADVEAIADDFNAVLNSFKVFVDTSGDDVGDQIGKYSSFPGYSSGVSSILVDNASSPYYNKTVYYLVLDGNPLYDEATVADYASYAILSNSSWATVPMGTDLGYPYDIQASSLDVVYGGIGSYTDSNGTHVVYTTQAVPEPAFYAAGLGVIALLVVQLHRRRKAA